MAYTWTQFKSAVAEAYNPGGNMTELGYAAVAAYVKSKICREVDGDLPLARSYMNDYEELKRRLAPYAYTANFATTQTAVNTRITVDAQRSAISTFIDAAIQEAMDDLNRFNALYLRMILSAAIDMQRHVVCLCQRQINTYLHSTVGVTNEGHVTKITPPTGSKIITLSYGKYAEPLEEDVAYVAEDRVQSNGRIYEVVTGGTLTAGQLGDGLQSVDGEDETLGSLVFKYIESYDFRPVTPIEWKYRDLLLDNKIAGYGPYYSISPQADELWVYPMLQSDEHQIRMEWNGLKISFADGDATTFDESCVIAAAEYVRAMIQKNADGNTNLAAGSMVTYQSELRRLWLDCQNRGNSLL